MSGQVLSAVLTLLDALTLEERGRVAERLERLGPREGYPSARAGKAFLAVEKVLANGTWVTAGSINNALKSEGIEIDLKAVYNALSYLHRSGRTIRVGRGRYRAIQAPAQGIEARRVEASDSTCESPTDAVGCAPS